MLSESLGQEPADPGEVVPLAQPRQEVARSGHRSPTGQINGRILMWYIWYRLYGIWYRLYGIWYGLYGIWYRLCGMWYRIHGIWYRLSGIWSMVDSTWYRNIKILKILAALISLYPPSSPAQDRV